MAQGLGAVVLAGGISRRLGTDKAMLELDGVPLLRHVVDRLIEISEDVVVISNAPEIHGAILPHSPGIRIVVTKAPGKGTVGGLYTGLSVVRGEAAFAVGCDMPFLNSNLIREMHEALGHFDAVVPRVAGYLQPAHAIYGKSCLPAIQMRIEKDEIPGVRSFLSDIRVRYVEENWIAINDPQFRSFRNLNTIANLSAAQEALKSWR
jgi:molybdopterin-guanine dinucleotide biosynthesis protein A